MIPKAPAVPSALPTTEHVCWRLAKRDFRGTYRIAEARIRRVLGGALVLYVLVGGEAAFSKAFDESDALKLIAYLSEECRQDFEELGWQPIEPESPAP